MSLKFLQLCSVVDFLIWNAALRLCDPHNHRTTNNLSMAFVIMSALRVFISKCCLNLLCVVPDRFYYCQIESRMILSDWIKCALNSPILILLLFIIWINNFYLQLFSLVLFIAYHSHRYSHSQLLSILYCCKGNEPKKRYISCKSIEFFFPAVFKVYVRTFIMNVPHVLTLMSQKNSRQ